MRILLSLLVVVLCQAQTNLSTPVTVLAKADRSAGGVENILDSSLNTVVSLGAVTAGVLGRFSNAINSNSVNIGGATIYELKGGVAGKTVWTLFDDGTGHGDMAVADGSGTGGQDGNGARIFCQASSSGCWMQNATIGGSALGNGQLVVYDAAGNLIVNAAGNVGINVTSVGGIRATELPTNGTIQMINSGFQRVIISDGTLVGGNAGYVAVNHFTGATASTMGGTGFIGYSTSGAFQTVALLNDPALSGGVLSVSDAVGNLKEQMSASTGLTMSSVPLTINSSTASITLGGVTTNIGQPIANVGVQVTGAAGNRTQMGLQTVYALNPSSQTRWFMAGTGNGGSFGVANGTGAGGFDGNGALILGNGTNGFLQVQSEDSTLGYSWSGVSGITGRTLTVRNAAGTGTCTISVNGGIITASTC